MSDDLISRKDLITEMEINIGNIYNPDIIKGMKFAIELINSRPTAFDKEKVINEIHISSAGMAVNMNVSSSYAEGYIDAAKDVIEIVEKGGIE